MTPETFDTELRNLGHMVGSWASDELFVESYKDLLMKVKKEQSAVLRMDRATRLKKLLMLQSRWLIQQWIDDDRKNKVGLSKGLR